jgi:hypothetical protein
MAATATQAGQKVSFRLTDQEVRFLRIVAGHVQATRGTLFMNQADALREALRIAAEAVATRKVPA